MLRFYCVWDDRQPLNGDRRPYVLNYYLEDDTVEVLEVHENNSGRDAFPVFLRRARLPKVRFSQLSESIQLFCPSLHSSLGWKK